MREEYLRNFFEEFEYPEEGANALFSGYATFKAAGLEGDFDGLIVRYEKDMLTDHRQLRVAMQALSQKAGVHEYQGTLLLMIALSAPLKGYYAQKGISLEIWRDSMLDLKYKMLECKQLYGVWGVNAGDWFAWFFQCKRFGFGKLQFEIAPFKWSYDFEGEIEIDGATLTAETLVLNTHIPNTGLPLDRESAHEAYARAKAFYKEFDGSIFQGDRVIFSCRSWLLFQRHKEVLKKESNLYRFMEDFNIVNEGEYPDYSLTWRIFGTKKLDDIEALPQKTSLQRAYAGWMKKGEKTGWAVGAFTR